MRLAANTLKKSLSERWVVPTFLCPSLAEGIRFAGSAKHVSRSGPSRLQASGVQGRCLHTQPLGRAVNIQPIDHSKLSFLPWTCPGCGAYTQTLNPDNAGFYSTSRKTVKAFVAAQSAATERKRAEEAVGLAKVDDDTGTGILESLRLPDTPGLENWTASLPDERTPDSAVRAFGDMPASPVCDRCHALLHHHKGTSIIHPTIQSIQDIIADSPYKYNHVYHVLDAADFPLSLIPQLQEHLSLMPQRSHNRRAKTSKFYHGQKSEMSFIITRSDLLAPTKEQVDSLMPYLLHVLRDALGPRGEDVRLGNVRCVSSQRGWWTTQLKDAIWERGGGGWMVGKVNVGKSSLFETVFPKGRSQVDFRALRQETNQGRSESGQGAVAAKLGPFHTEGFDQQGLPVSKSPLLESTESLNEDSLLPPAPVETDYPVMPIVSSLPGTTASPIRLPFGGGRGELIDLPGLDRGNLEAYVSEEHKLDLVMQSRIKPKQYVVKHGQSILIGGLIRITPTTPDIVLLACPFVPLDSHVTNTDKAIAIQTQSAASGIPTIAAPGAGAKVASAGVFELKWDVTKQRAGPLTASSAVGLKPQVLPFTVFSTDILVEGCGWVELAVQLRKRDYRGPDVVTHFPSVEVFSPEGKHIGARRPMNAWVLGAQRKQGAGASKARPRRSMKGVKKNMKKIARSSATALTE
ncbi:hypothetical protein MMC30_008335 [Trapelia coarctata]|nr:hypothetical protein [Trapelia coarctata]